MKSKRVQRKKLGSQKHDSPLSIFTNSPGHINSPAYDNVTVEMSA